jgi:hypothetical protein
MDNLQLSQERYNRNRVNGFSLFSKFPGVSDRCIIKNQTMKYDQSDNAVFHNLDNSYYLVCPLSVPRSSEPRKLGSQIFTCEMCETN